MASTCSLRSMVKGLVLLATLYLWACNTIAELEPEPDLSRTQNPDGSALALRTTESFSGFMDDSGSLPVDITILGEVRPREFVDDAMRSVSQMYQQCGIPVKATVNEVSVETAQDIDVAGRYRLTHEYASDKPGVFIVESTAERDVAFSYLPSLQRDVSGTAWITNRVSDACFAWIIAHEIGHLVLNDATHHPQRDNIMNAQCSQGSFNTSSALPRWTPRQCELIRSAGTL